MTFPAAFATEALLLLDGISNLEAYERLNMGDQNPIHSRSVLRVAGERFSEMLAERELTSVQLQKFISDDNADLRELMKELRGIVNTTKPEGFRIIIEGYDGGRTRGAIYMKLEDELWRDRFFPAHQMIDDTGLRDADTGDEVGPFRRWLGSQTAIFVSERVFPEGFRFRS